MVGQKSKMHRNAEIQYKYAMVVGVYANSKGVVAFLKIQEYY